MGTNFTIFLLLGFVFSYKILYAESRKELRNKGVNQEPTIQLGHPIQSNRVKPSRVMQLSWQPRVFLYRGFLSDEECNHLISLANDKNKNLMEEGSDSVDQDTSKEHASFEIQTNTKDDIAARIEERISAWTFMPKGNGKPLQVLHFGSEDAKNKYDYFGNKSIIAPSNTFMVAVVLYLSNVSHGGEILFPESKLENSQTKNKISWSDCTKSENTLRPTKGNALLFFNLHLNASADESSSHGRCPVLEGDMWCAVKLFHVRSITRELEVTRQKIPFQSEEIDCADEDENCPHWARLGECQRNAVFMVGTPDYYGTCRKSCHVC